MARGGLPVAAVAPLLCLWLIARQVRAFVVSFVAVASAIRAARLLAVKELDFRDFQCKLIH
jgi:hypothetical protein